MADTLDSSPLPCYDARGLLRMFDHLSTISRHLNTPSGWANYANDHEDASSPVRAELPVRGRLTTPDRAILFRYMAGVALQQRGLIATFMP